jgi:hypothetical protein
LYQQLHRGAKSGLIHEIVRQGELRTLECADLVLYCSEEDLIAFREMAPEAKFHAASAANGVTLFAAPARAGKFETDAFTAVFMGSDHPPNVRAAEFIAHTLAPRLPEITFDFIGSCLPEGQYPSNVRRHGMVDDELKNR